MFNSLFICRLRIIAVMFCLCCASALGEEPPPPADRIAAWRSAAEQGDATAQFNLGISYAKGTGVVKNEKEAVRWYRKAAEQGLASAQNNLGACYCFGKGVVKNEPEAVKWFEAMVDDVKKATVMIIGY